MKFLSLNKAIDNRALIVFRIFFGLLMILESFGAIATGWVKETFVDPKYAYPFFGFEWTEILWGSPMYFVYVLMGVFGFGIMLGYRYRLSIICFTLLWATTYFAQKSHYNNHYYLVMLIAAAMCFMPAHRYYSLDVRQKRVQENHMCLQWTSQFYKLQMLIVYVFASLAKLYPDWLHAEPVKIWLGRKTHYPIVGQLFELDWFPYFIAYAGIGYDLLIVPLLMWRKTRWFAIGISLVFHLFNSAVFQIGIFPYFALAMSIFYFDADQIKKAFFTKRVDHFSLKKFDSKPLFYVIFFGYFLIQLWLPVRHWFLKDDVLWNETGHRLAWRMMLRTKSGYCTYEVKTKAGIEKAKTSDFISPHQRNDVATRPDMLWRSVRYLEREYNKKGISVDEIKCKCNLSVNGRKHTPFVDHTVDLLHTPWERFKTQSWILPSSFHEKEKIILD